METLIQQERFEIEVLDYLNSGRFLEHLVFVGGTMLRLCHGLERFSVDLDFWCMKQLRERDFFDRLKNHLRKRYLIRDAACKFFTILFEIGREGYPRSLKIEIQREIKKVTFEKCIAFSQYSNAQVLVNTASLKDMMRFKIESFLNRGEIRDCFDLEFLVKRGIPLKVSTSRLKRLEEAIGALTGTDYKVKLASVIEKKLREYYTRKNFEILLGEVEKTKWRKSAT